MENKYRKEIMAVLMAIQKLGHEIIWADDGGERFKLKGKAIESATKLAAEVVLSVDESHVGFKTPKGNKFWIFFVLGNGAGEAVADWSIPADAAEAKELDKALTAVSRKFEEVA